ncbi:extracellular solute-binding protein [Paenibacillus sp. OSY-SE]|uniref:extracellular solute-binding protein n=1 Tax=Paenibacillus sp. OSY-SE TaxID=1196323 RepID=UPI000474F4F4|nr:extracellular solute-binding protein [Paenibacillus sp. OSY-SE]
MKNNFKKTCLTVLSLLVMLSLVSACGNSTEAEPTEPSGATNSTPTSSTKEKKLVRYVMPGTAPQDQAAVEAAINKKLEKDGLDLTYQATYIPWDVWDQKTNLMMSTGEEFELIHIMHDSKGPNVLANNGGIIPIDKYLDEYGSELKKSLPDWVWNIAKISGETYFVPNFWLDSAYADGMVTVRQDLLDANHLQAPHSADDLIHIAETLKSNWPDANKDVYIRTLNTEPAYYLHPTYETYPFTVFQNLIRVDQEGKISAWIESDEFKKDAEFYRTAYQDGLINPDILTAPTEVLNNEEMLGRFLFREGDGISDTLPQKVPGAKLEGYFLKDTVKFRSYGVRNSNGISATSPHPEAAIQFLNWVYSSQDNFDLVLYGIEGEHWKNVGEGKLDILKVDSNGNPSYQLASWMLGHVEMIRWAENTNPTILKYRASQSDDAVNSITLGFNFDATKVSVEYTNTIAEFNTSILPIKLGLLDYETAFPEALKKMKTAGLDKVVAEYERQFQEWMQSK